jgi:ubiquinone/menaquinone biosynthesis C-methylase UbiE
MNNHNDNYYDVISGGYDELYREEQLKKLDFINSEIRKNGKLSGFFDDSCSLLDVGCGTGISTSYFKCRKSTGTDPSANLLKIARKHYPGIKFVKAYAESLPFNDGEFDIVISLTAIQNFNDIDKGLSEIMRVGEGRYILTFLKKSSNHHAIDGLIRKRFKVLKKSEEDKDMIYFCTNDIS